jgi:hypothetical protein
MHHAAFPRNAAELKALGAGYANCAPTPESQGIMGISCPDNPLQQHETRPSRFGTLSILP